MHTSLNIGLVLVLVQSLCVIVTVAQSSLICSKITEFSACTNKYALKAAGCSAAVKDTPTLEFYMCQCSTYTEMNTCYMLCPDDASIQLQYAEIRKTQSSACLAVDDMKKQGFTTSTTTTSTTMTKTTVQTSTTKSLSPTESANTTKSDDGFVATMRTNSTATVVRPMGTPPVMSGTVIKCTTMVQAFIVGLLVVMFSKM
jgi:hypothetical protein